MFTINTQIKSFLTKSHGLKADASDDEARDLLGTKLMGGEIDMAEVRRLSKSNDAATKVSDLIDERVKGAVAPLNEKVDSLITLLSGKANGHSTADAKAAAAPGGSKAREVIAAGSGAPAGGAADDVQIRVKSAVERYSDVKTAARYSTHSKSFSLKKAFGDSQVRTGELGDPLARELNMPTERTKAIAGSWFKFMVHKDMGGRGVPHALRMTEHDWDMVQYALHESKFIGPVNCDEKGENAKHWCNGDKMPELYVKALLGDSTSGGTEAVPYEFDDVAVITPLLNGELFPLVNLRTANRNQMKGFSIANPTLSWGVAEGSDIPLFDTSAFVAAFNTNIYPVTGAIELGLDFEDDSPVSIGDIIVERYGQQYLKEIDTVIAKGTGSQPTGIINTAGLTSVSGTTAATPLVSEYESALFGVAKEYRPKNELARQVFIGNETSYQRARSMAVGPSDQRRVLGMDEEGYEVLGHPYKIVQALSSTTTATQVMFACMRYYRMFRRTGFQVRVVTEDAQLARQNKRLIVVRSRVGGQMELSAAAIKILYGA